jgi:hypothetical protein
MKSKLSVNAQIQAPRKNLKGIITVRNPIVTSLAGKPTLLLGDFELADLGYIAEEFFISGTATSYTSDADLDSDGRWSAVPSAKADFVTRVVILKPMDTAKFNGTAIVEWLNVTGGTDTPVDWLMAHREIVRAGSIYVAVSAQRVGVEGGQSLGADNSLKTINPERYSHLSHPGDAFSYDIFSQAGRLVRDAQHNGILGSLRPDYVLAVGESQSAMFLTTYVNAVDLLAKVYDGFLIHSRFASAGPLDGRSIFGPLNAGMPISPKFRPDVRVPLINVITETDLIGGPRPGYYLARQPDSEFLRTWEIAGTAHADNYIIQVGRIDTGFASLADLVAAYAPTSKLMGAQLAQSINFAPQHHYVVQAALVALHSWVRSGEPAPIAQPIELTDTNPPQLILDENGLATGGIRTPWVDVPIARTSGLGNENNVMASLFGSGEPFDAAILRRLYPCGTKEYLAHFEASLDTAIAQGFVLVADRQEILELASAMFPSALY